MRLRQVRCCIYVIGQTNRGDKRLYLIQRLACCALLFTLCELLQLARRFGEGIETYRAPRAFQPMRKIT